MRVLICGGGVIGASIAYFLALRGVEAVVVERTDIACAASGKSGGFLARDWCDGSALASLARRSFALHGELAAELGGDWGYRRLETLGVLASARGDLGSYRRLPAPAWLGPEAVVHHRLGTPDDTAQVHPGAFTRAMMAAAEARGARLHRGSVVGLALSRDGSAAQGVLVDGGTMPGDAVVVAMGPWSTLARRWLPLPAVQGLKGHSLVLRSPTVGPAQAVFAEVEDDDGRVHAPEVFPRPDGTTYVCGLPGTEAVPPDPAEVLPEPGGAERLLGIVARFAPALAAADVLAVQACYRPVARDGLPLIGRVPGIEDAYVATGHSVWGILNAPATGEAMAELILDGRTRLDLSPFDPARLPEVPA